MVVLLCGRIASGKTTFARLLARDYRFVHCSTDAWMRQLYDDEPDRARFEALRARCEEQICRVMEQVLVAGGRVVWDAGFWTKAERLALRERFGSLGVPVHMVYLPVDDATQQRWLDQRQVSGEDHYHFDAATLAFLNSLFEEPTASEACLSPEALHRMLAE